MNYARTKRAPVVDWFLFGLAGRALIVVMAVSLIAGSAAPASDLEADKETTGRSYGFEEIAEPLQMLAAQARGNYELISTWSAKFDFTDEFYFPGPLPANESNPSPDAPAATTSGFWEVTRGEVEFQWDIASERLHVFYRPTKPVEAIEAVEPGTQRSVQLTRSGNIYHWILTPEHWIEFGHNVHLGQVDGFPPVTSVAPEGGRIAYRKARRQADRETRVVNPMDFFSLGNRPVWWQCERYSKLAKGNDVQKAKEFFEKNVTLLQRPAKDGTEFMLTIKYPRSGIKPVETPIVQTTFHSDAGLLPTSWSRSVNLQVQEEQTFSYKKYSGIYLPAIVQFKRFRPVGPARVLPTMSRTFVLKSTTVNKPISSTRFSIERLQLTYGERMLDEIEKQLFVMDDDGLVPAENFSLDPARSPEPLFPADRLDPSGERNWTLIIINVLAVLALIAFLVFRSKRDYAS